MQHTRSLASRAVAIAAMGGLIAVAACSSPDYMATTQRSTTTTTQPMAPMAPPAMATTTTTTSHTVTPTP